MKLLAPRLRVLLLNRYTAFLLFMAAYTGLLQLAGGLSSLVFHWYVEGPLVLYLYHLIYTVMRPGRWRAWVAALPIVLVYAMFDGYFMVFGQVFRLDQFYNLGSLLTVMPKLEAVGFMFVLLLPLLIVLTGFNPPRWKHALGGLLPLALLAASTHWFSQRFVDGFEHLGTDIVAWSDSTNVEHNGRLAMMLYFEADRSASMLRSASYRDRPTYETDAATRGETMRTRGNQRNVHLVVLESFLDPTLFSKVEFSRNPRHPEFAKLFGDKLGYSVSPVFGGGTAEAEFEALCGVPAFGTMASIQFNAFTGAPAHCMPDILARAGYRTMATNAYKPDFFNAINAYTGAGFKEMYFPAEYARSRETYFSTGDVSEDEKYMFDGTLFEQNLHFVEEALRTNPEQPLFNYVLSIYGHFPHHIDDSKRPQVLSAKGLNGDHPLVLAANQHWYRTQAIAAYVRALMRIDPDSIIVLVSDHVPPLDGFDSYRDYGYMTRVDNVEDGAHVNRIAVIENGKPVRYRTISHYDIPSLVYNYLTDGGYCKSAACNLYKPRRARDDYMQDYMRLMAHAVDTESVPAEAPKPTPPVQHTAAAGGRPARVSTGAGEPWASPL